nr:myotubularin-related protein DDB_G0290005-like [Halyomorpha halys]
MSDDEQLSDDSGYWSLSSTDSQASSTPSEVEGEREQEERLERYDEQQEEQDLEQDLQQEQDRGQDIYQEREIETREVETMTHNFENFWVTIGEPGPSSSRLRQLSPTIQEAIKEPGPPIMPELRLPASTRVIIHKGITYYVNYSDHESDEIEEEAEKEEVQKIKKRK